MNLFILQETLPVGFWEEVQKLGGIFSVILLIGYYFIIKAYHHKDSALTELNKRVSDDAKEGIRVITSFEKLFERLIADQSSGEHRIIEVMKNEGAQIKEQLHEFKEHLQKGITDNRNAQTH